ncbi:hypothetical protein Tco_1348915, partial [Tanacetum coccineum]
MDALGASVTDEDANHKFLRSLPPAWDSLAMTMRTKKNIDTLSIDDLYNNLSVFEQDIQKTSSSSLTSDNESTICIVKNPVYHSKTKHIEIRHHFIRDCYEKKLIQVQKIHTDLNVADLLTKPFDGP